MFVLHSFCFVLHLFLLFLSLVPRVSAGWVSAWLSVGSLVSDSFWSTPAILKLAVN